MVFIRIKTVKDIDYLYLVESKWDPSRKTSTQKTIKYLGKASDINIEDIPIEYRNSPQILSKINVKIKNNKKSQENENIKEQIFNALKNGEVEKILRIVKTYNSEKTLASFYDNILKQVLYEIGSLWEQNKLDIATEHVCSNIANKIIFLINKLYKKNNEDKYKKLNIILCTPDGELHNIACNILESILLQKGYKVYNISPSIPTESIIKYIKEINPSLIMISVTLADNIGSAKRLIKKINSEFNIPILLGGQAITKYDLKEKKDIEKININTKIIRNTTLETLTQVVRESIKMTIQIQ
jgi:MerR family transcriptional regulator, light-induced transcriptional regulator